MIEEDVRKLASMIFDEPVLMGMDDARLEKLRDLIRKVLSMRKKIRAEEAGVTDLKLGYEGSFTVTTPYGKLEVRAAQDPASPTLDGTELDDAIYLGADEEDLSPDAEKRLESFQVDVDHMRRGAYKGQTLERVVGFMRKYEDLFRYAVVNNVDGT